MRRRHLIAVLAVIVVSGFSVSKASAYCHPSLGRWLQRDPGPGGMMPTPRVGMAGPAVGDGFVARDPMPMQAQPWLQYTDGMNLYQYAGSPPLPALTPQALNGR